MEYNTEISNNDVLPIPYMEVYGVGESQTMRIKQLFSKQPLRVQSNCVSINNQKQIVVEMIGRAPKLVFDVQPGLSILNADLKSAK
jgi:hypothetical protein